MPLLFISPYAFTRIGPSLASVPLAKLRVKALPTKAAAKVPMIFVLLAMIDDSKVLRPPDMLPANPI
jgi:hypothetical protein